MTGWDVGAGLFTAMALVATGATFRADVAVELREALIWVAILSVVNAVDFLMHAWKADRQTEAAEAWRLASERFARQCTEDARSAIKSGRCPVCLSVRDEERQTLCSNDACGMRTMPAPPALEADERSKGGR